MALRSALVTFVFCFLAAIALGYAFRLVAQSMSALYQINTRAWLTAIGRRIGRMATLDDVPDEELDRVARLGFDWVWLLSVWRTGAESRRISREHAQLRAEFARVLPDLSDADIGGSGFAIAAYEADPSIGGAAALARMRARLGKRGVRLMLDFVPNHVAVDHPWVGAHPEYFVEGSETELAEQPGNYLRVRTRTGPRMLAHGRDPHFPGWTDTLQLDYANPATQTAMIGELTTVAAQCDGVRCDMAMLLLPDVFARTWGRRPDPFWSRAIAQVRERFPEFRLLAEVYWDLEWRILDEGFDYAYDKALYDRLREGLAPPVRDHLRARIGSQQQLARFLENHDEPRAAAVFAPDTHEAAAIITFLAPGLRFFQHGQIEGRRMHISPHLVRAPEEPLDQRLRDFYERLLSVLRRPAIERGTWQPLDCVPAWVGNNTWDGFVAYGWRDAASALLVIVNYAATQGQCCVRVPVDVPAATLRFSDLMSGAIYDRGGSDLASRGLFVDLPPWGHHVFDVRAW